MTKPDDDVMDIVEALHNPQLLGYDISSIELFKVWEVVLRALFGLGFINDWQRETYRQFSHRMDEPSRQFREGILICGRRAMKSYIMAMVAVFCAIFRDYRPYLRRKQKATIKVIAADREQARNILDFIAGMLEAPLLAPYLIKQKTSSFELKNRCVIEVGTCSAVSNRGYAIPVCLCDEACRWNDNSGVSPASAVFESLRPAMKTFPNPLLLIGSSPWGRFGAVWELYSKYFGVENQRTFVWQADTRSMNASVPQEEIDIEYENDAISAAGEYGAIFRSDVQALISAEAWDAATINGRYELPYNKTIQYFAAVDASGGSSDSMTLAISHRSDDDDKGVLDLVREIRPPFSPDNVCFEFSQVMKSYGLASCSGDRYGLAWVEEGFKKHGVTLNHTEMDRSAIYLNFLPMLNSGRLEVLDLPVLRRQALSLERKCTRIKEIVDHVKGSHDDVINSAALALVDAAGQLSGAKQWEAFGDAYDEFRLEMGWGVPQVPPGPWTRNPWERIIE